MRAVTEVYGSLTGFLRRPFVVMIVFGLAVRLIIAPLLTPNNDMAYWMRIMNMAESGMGLYVVEGYYYTPPWGYFLSVVAFIGTMLGITDFGTFVSDILPAMGSDFVVLDAVPSIAFSVLLKIPLILIDLLVAVLIHRVVSSRTGDERKALLASSLWFLSPLVIAESSIHVMFDNMAVLGIILCLMLMSSSRYCLAGAAFSFAVLTKFFSIFLIFFLIAYVLKKEGMRNGASALGKAMAGAAASFLLIELPSILSGDFWESMNFITSRIGIDTATAASLFSPAAIAAIVAVLAIIVIAVYLVEARRGAVSRLMASASTEAFHSKLKKAMVAIAMLTVVAGAVYLMVSVGGDTFAELFGSIGMRFVMILSVFSLLIELYLAYRLLFIPGEDADTTLMLSAVVIFLWPPAPQYVVFLIPFVAVYAAVRMPRLVTPLMIMSSAFTIYELALSNSSMLFSLSEYTGLLGMSPLIAVSEAMCSYIGPIPVIAVVMAVFGIISYVAMLYVPYRWFKEVRTSVEES